jgi:hypothetical protein
MFSSCLPTLTKLPAHYKLTNVTPLELITRLDNVTIKRHCIPVETDITT